MKFENIKIWGIIPAAGIGVRMGSAMPKQYLKLSDKSVLEHSLDKLLACNLISGVVVGVAEQDSYWQELTINNERFLGFYTGGAQRCNTVLNGIDYLSSWANNQDWVLVHDAVRPCVEVDDVEFLIQKGLQSKSGAILANTVIDTVKKLNSKGKIIKTLDRNQLILALTPQIFPISLLTKALRKIIGEGQLATDESFAVERLGLKPIIVAGKRNNIKITVAEDLHYAKMILDKQLSKL